MERLNGLNQWNTYKNEVNDKLDADEIERRYDNCLALMTNGNESLEFGIGRWLEKIKGKKVFARLANSNCFRVQDRDGNLLQGREKLNEIARNLLQKDIAIQPRDFRRLKALIYQRLEE